MCRHDKLPGRHLINHYLSVLKKRDKPRIISQIIYKPGGIHAQIRNIAVHFRYQIFFNHNGSYAELL